MLITTYNLQYRKTFSTTIRYKKYKTNDNELTLTIATTGYSKGNLSSFADNNKDKKVQ